MKRTKAKCFPALDLLLGMNTLTTVPYPLHTFQRSLLEQSSGKLDMNTDFDILQFGQNWIEGSSGNETPWLKAENEIKKTEMEKIKGGQPNLNPKIPG
ncbi:hypothetical protein Tco_1000557 [Tanacetum coccineum]